MKKSIYAIITVGIISIVILVIHILAFLYIYLFSLAAYTVFASIYLLVGA